MKYFNKLNNLLNDPCKSGTGPSRHNSSFASHGAGHYQRHGARLAAESDWVLLARVADRLCGEEGERRPRGENKPFTAFA